MVELVVVVASFAVELVLVAVVDDDELAVTSVTCNE